MRLAPPVPLDGIDRVLASLPDPVALAAAGEARLVIGPTGAFVVLSGGTDLRHAGERASELAAATRTSLAQHLAWIPFVDAVVVGAADGRARPRATVVPFDLLSEVLREGPAVIDDGVLAAVRDLLRTGRIPGWRVGIGDDAARIDLCDPASEPTSPESVD